MNEPKSTAGNAVWIVAGLVFILAAFLLSPNFNRAWITKKYTTCLVNLKQIGGALKRYHKDTNGKYPSTLSILTPKYIKSIPTCMETGRDTYSQGYQVSDDLNRFTLCCKGDNHKNVGNDPDYPRYYSESGLVMRRIYEPSPSPTKSMTQE